MKKIILITFLSIVSFSCKEEIKTSKEKESEEDKGIENGNEVEKDDKEEKEKGIDKVQDIRDFYSKLSCGGGGGGVESNKNCVLCMCVGYVNKDT